MLDLIVKPLLLGLLISACHTTQAYTEAELKCYQSGAAALDDAIGLCEKAAKAGDSHAQFKLATLYAQMPGDKLKQSLKWLLLAAEQAHPEAQYNIASAYYYGRGVAVDYGLAADWYRKSANLDYARAQRNLAHMYETGVGVGVNMRKAFLWYEKSATHGERDAQLKAGIMLYNGEGTKVDRDKGLDWIRQAASKGGADAQFTLAAILMPTQPDDAVLWYRQAAAQGQVHAMYNLARFYMGPGIDMDLDGAMLLIDRAVKAGHAESVKLSIVIEDIRSQEEKTKASLDVVTSNNAAQAEGRDWLRSMPPENFTLQLVMSSSLSGVRAFVLQHQLAKQAHIYHLSLGSKTNYVVLLGSFANRWEVESGISNLPKSLINPKPFPKRIEMFVNDGYVLVET